MRRRWSSGRALALHLAMVVVVSGCLIAGWWQIGRAKSGNLLSYGYAVEWPVFAVVAVVFWWQLIHYDPADRDPQTREAHDGSSPRAAPPERRRENEAPALRAYNDNLAALAAKARRKTWRNPTGLR